MADKAKESAAGKPLTKSAVYQELATATNLTKKQVSDLFDALAGLIKKELGKKGPGVFTVPGLFKLNVKRIPATKARKGLNPFTKEEMVFKAKPARTVVKARALKGLNEMVK